MKKENTPLDAMQDIGRAFNGGHQYGVLYHAVLYKSGFSRRPSLCNTFPDIAGNGWGWLHDTKNINCKECINKIAGF